MIIFGYPGIGKTTVAKEDWRFIDLDSGDPTIRGLGLSRFSRKDWLNHYCNTALLLSKQGYFVFVSTHPDVMKRLIAKEKRVLSVFPDQKLEQPWTDRLYERYQGLRNQQTHNAWRRAKDHFPEDISELERTDCPRIRLTTMNYNLKKEIMEFCEGRWGT